MKSLPIPLNKLKKKKKRTKREKSQQQKLYILSTQ